LALCGSPPARSIRSYLPPRRRSCGSPCNGNSTPPSASSMSDGLHSLPLRRTVLRRHQHSGRADAALSRTMIEEGLLQDRQGSVGSQTFDRLDPSTRHLPHRHQAGADLPASSRTVQAPQSPASQPILVPVRPRSSRSAAARRATGAPSHSA
jgi:hypothetical protein